MQVTHQVFVTKEWVKHSREELNAEVQARLTVEKATSALIPDKDHLNKEVKEALKAQASVEERLKTITK